MGPQEVGLGRRGQVRRGLACLWVRSEVYLLALRIQEDC